MNSKLVYLTIFMSFIPSFYHVHSSRDIPYSDVIYAQEITEETTDRTLDSELIDVVTQISQDELQLDFEPEISTMDAIAESVPLSSINETSALIDSGLDLSNDPSIEMDSDVYDGFNIPDVSNQTTENSIEKSTFGSSIEEQDSSTTVEIEVDKLDDTEMIVSQDIERTESETLNDPIDVPQADLFNIPSLPNMNPISPLGNNIVITLVITTIGFVEQPISNQTIAVGDDLDFSFKTTSYFTNPINVNIYQWKETSPGVVTQAPVVTQQSVRTGGGTTQDVNLAPITGLTAGVYYFQFGTGLNTSRLLGIGGDIKMFYSDIAKVTVLENPTSLSVSAPEVIFEKVPYSATAGIFPADADGEVRWSNPGITYTPQIGLNTSFIYQEQSNVVNQNVNTPGIPLTLSASAVNPLITILGSKQIYAGGLAAKVVSQDSGFSWEVDLDGLRDLDNNVGEVDYWEYKWQYVDQNVVKDFSESSGANHVEGRISSVTELNNPDQKLEFDVGSSFMQEAYEATERNQSYSVFVTLSSTKDGIVTQYRSNRALLTVTQPSGLLFVEEVPQFNFGLLKAESLYSGTWDNPPSILEKMAIVDTRLDSSGWVLMATETPFQEEAGTMLESTTTIRFRSTGLEFSISDNGVTTGVANGSGSQVYVIESELILDKNPSLSLNGSEVFSSTIRWDLVTSEIVADPL